MKCPKCGSDKAKYTKPRSTKKKPREDFSAKCRACKFEFDAREHYDVESNVTVVVEEKFTIKMKYNEGETR